MPHERSVGAERLQRPDRVAVVVRARELDHRDARVHSRTSTSYDSISGFASSCLHISLDALARLVGRGRLHFDVDDAPDARFRDREPELAQRLLDRLALRIEDAFLRPDEHRRPHRSTTSGSARYSSNEIPVSRSNASTYFARVSVTTSSGSSGPGYVLSQPTDSQ